MPQARLDMREFKTHRWRDFFLLLLTSAGLFLAVHPIGPKYVAFLGVEKPARAEFSPIASRPVSSVSGFNGDFEETELEMTLHISLEYPKRVMIGDSFFVRAHVSPKTIVLVITKGNAWAKTRIVTRRPLSPDEAELYASSVKMALEASSEFTLNLAGGEVKPEGPTKPINDMVTWSVAAKGPGTLRGVLVTSNKAPSADFDLPEAPTFSVTAFENPFGTGTVLGWIPRILGALLTIPGILAFRKEYLKRKEEARKTNETERQIVIP